MFFNVFKSFDLSREAIYAYVDKSLTGPCGFVRTKNFDLSKEKTIVEIIS